MDFDPNMDQREIMLILSVLNDQLNAYPQKSFRFLTIFCWNVYIFVKKKKKKWKKTRKKRITKKKNPHTKDKTACTPTPSPKDKTPKTILCYQKCCLFPLLLDTT